MGSLRKPWLLLLLVAALPSVLAPFWGARALRLCSESSTSYAACREEVGFAGLPIESLRSGIDRLLPRGAPLTLAPELSADTVAWQRLTEGLYPRRVTNDAANTLALAESATGVLPEWPGKGHFVLTGSQVRAVPAGVNAQDPAPSDVWLLGNALALFGLGLCCAWMVNRVAFGWLGVSPGASVLVLLGGVGVAIVYSLATWFRFAVPVSTLRLVGWSALGVAVLRAVLRLNRPSLRAMFTEYWRWGSLWWLCVLLPTVMLCMYWARVPISGWDGRSIWFFRAHEIAQHGVFHPLDVFNPAYLFSNPSYPLFFSSWLAFFGAHEVFNERHAAMGMAVLLWALVTPIASQLRARHGSLLGSVVSLALLGSAAVSLAGGYPDGVLAAALLLGVLCLFAPDAQGLAGLAFVVAGICKREGLVLVAVILLLHLLVASDRKQLRVRLLFLTCLIPGVAHALWYGKTNLPEIYAGSALPAPAEVLPMLGVLLARFFGSILVPPEKLLALAALVLVLVQAREHRFSLRRPMVELAGAALLAFAFAAVSVMVSPFRFEWHVDTAFDRVILTGCWLSVAAVPGRRPNDAMTTAPM
jgi:hypothetical protein